MTARTVGVILLVAISACTSLKRPPEEVEPWFPSVNERGDPVSAVFEGRVPCADADPTGCEKIKVALVLYHDSESGELTTYKLARVYVADTPEGRRTVSEGIVTVTQGTKLDPRATVYELDTNTPLDFQFYWVIGDDILFILDQDRKPRVGTASWSFALSRTR